ncbi:MAG TPA: bifunctional 5,10-methylenetetrahydrofolate dehydrogenase/5,10-methenyltetrahydrofolate cyclohydrolase [Candidatus Saccharimonadales bacterium]|nr:bifunctional 5,10-methylenetetrahydrofolate dehydrogenase/5,10-methenyltetrahydrofolate cyclohydrolase [Candidatus Saccharimonadales bacterium]
MVKLIDGKLIAERIKDEITQTIFELNGPRPNLAIILVGEREDSKIYVALKQREGVKVGVDTQLYEFEADSNEHDVLAAIKFLNQDEAVDGILVQLPLPKKFNTNKIIEAIDPEKDVDGFHPQHPDYIISPVLASVAACLEEIKMTGTGKLACALYNSDVFGRGIEEVLVERGFKICPRQDIKKADLIVSALGEPHKIKQDMVKDGVVIIDIGISKVGDEVLGDADSEDLKDKASYITPVPGGIGPMTIAFLFKNVLEIFNRNSDMRE